MRAFIAIHLSREALVEVLRIQKRLRNQLDDQPIKWTAAENIHLTLRFLGNIETDCLSASLRKTGHGHKPFSLTLEGPGVFPSLRKPSVLWVGLAPCPELLCLQSQIEQAVGETSSNKEDRAFHPHITVGLVKRKPKSAYTDQCLIPSRIRASLATIQVKPSRWPVGSFQLMRSQTGKAGPVYSIIESFLLGH